MTRRMNRRERKLVKTGQPIPAIVSFKNRTGYSLKDSHAELKRIRAKQGSKL